MNIFFYIIFYNTKDWSKSGKNIRFAIILVN